MLFSSISNRCLFIDRSMKMGSHCLATSIFLYSGLFCLKEVFQGTVACNFNPNKLIGSLLASGVGVIRQGQYFDNRICYIRYFLLFGDGSTCLTTIPERTTKMIWCQSVSCETRLCSLNRSCLVSGELLQTVAFFLVFVYRRRIRQDF